MNLINNNPYRILGLPVTAGEKEIARQINRLDTLAFTGKEITLATDYPFLPDVDRSSDVIEEAKKQIEQDDGKVFYSLFWFLENNVVDELALEVLKEGNTNKAIEIWEKSSLTNKHIVYKPQVLNSNLIASSSHFSIEDNEDHKFKKDGDEYIVERKKDSDYSIPTALYELNYEDNWVIECDTQWLDGVDNVSYGIAFGRTNGSYYFFGIAGSGSYIYGKYDDWTYVPYIEWKENYEFNKWGSNRIRIEKIENTLKFYINEEFVNTWEAEPFFGKSFGFKVSKSQKISFRNFKFSKLVEDETYGAGLHVSSKNFSSIKNLSTLYLGLSTASTKGTFKISHFKKGVALAENIFANEQIRNYSKLIAGEKYEYNSEKTLNFYMNGILESVSLFLDKTDGISTGELINSFSTFPVEARQFLNQRFVAKPFHNIEKAIEIAKGLRRNSGKSAGEGGKILVKNTKQDIEYLKTILGEADFQYQIIADKLSLEIVQCGADAFNFWKTVSGDTDYLNAIKSEEGYLHEYEYALSIAVGHLAKKGSNENLVSCKEWIGDKHLYFCWFCGNNEPEESSEYEITIYKVIIHDYQGVKYQYLPIKIPRCPKCKNFHQLDYHFESSTNGTNSAQDVVVFVTEYIFLNFGVNLLSFLAKTISKLFDKNRRGIKDSTFSTLSNFPVIKERLLDGWKFEKPKA